MSKKNWYSSESWYAPLYREKPAKKDRGSKRPRLSFGWRLGIGLALVLGLIVLSSVLFSGAEPEIGFDGSFVYDNGFVYEGELPDDWQEYFESYYGEVEGPVYQYNLERVTEPVDYVLEFEKPGKELSLQELYEKCYRPIVSIMGYVDGVEGYAWGSGFIVSEYGLVITNSHIVEGCDYVVVKLHDDSSYEAKLVGGDSTCDIALLKIEATGLPAVEFGDSGKLKVGDKVAAIGNPLGENFRMTFTDGIVSALERGMDYNGSKMNLIQTNTAMNKGSSGGALFNIYGQVVGITNMKMTSSFSTVEGIAFAIPSATIRSVVHDLVEYGEVRGRPSIGITVGPIAPDAAEHYGIPGGLYISAVSEGSDAKAKGIREGDIITAVNGNPARTNDDVLDVKNSLIVGDSINFTIWRDGESFDVDVILVDTNDIY